MGELPSCSMSERRSPTSRVRAEAPDRRAEAPELGAKAQDSRAEAKS